MSGIWLVVIAYSCISQIASDEYTGNGETKEYWLSLGKADLHKARATPTVAVAKNVILLVGDGMGVSTVTAARILKGQLAGNPGEESVFSFEKFPYTALSKTYNQDHQTPDSAGTATAMMCGVKTNKGVLGMDARALSNNCSSSFDTDLESIKDWAEVKGKSIGIVTNTRITHATPASLYAKTPGRSWENDAEMRGYPDTEGCTDIAAQLIDNNIDIQVLLGGGRRNFLDESVRDEEGKSGDRRDGRNLVEEWQQKQAALGRSYQYVWNKSGFQAVDPVTTDYLFGLFESSHMEYVLERDGDSGGEPSLYEMVEKAIQILSKNPNGFFLMVEGGRIDHGHHSNKAKKSLYEAVEFAEAVEMAGNLTDEEDTLTIVTADHSHVFTVGGYQSRGNPIFGLTDKNGQYRIANDDKTYTTLMYANGKGSWSTSGLTTRPDPSTQDISDEDYRFQANFPISPETHGAEDVTIYAKGPMAHLVSGVREQSYIAHVMAYASCVGPYSDPRDCAMADVEGDDDDSDSVDRFG